MKCNKNKRNPKRKIILDGNEVYTTVLELANKLTYAFSRASATNSYSREFQAPKVAE